MTLQSILGILLVLGIILIFSQIWFHFVEGILGFIKRILGIGATPTAWHTLPPESERKEKEDAKH